ncbi:YncE family protein [Bizionia sp. KMM 8389]
MTKFLKLFSFCVLAVMLQNCTSDDRDIIIGDPPASGDYANGVFVLNEGGYTYSNASVSFIDNTDEIYHNVFYSVNEIDLGDVAQSMAFYEDKAFILLNNSNTIEVVNRYSFEHITTIENQILSPRYMVFNNGKGYVTNWGDPADTTDDYVAVIDLDSYTVTQTISVAEGPDYIINSNANLYVAHSGGWGYGNTISVLNSNTNTVVTTIDVGDVPTKMVKHFNDLYVMCSGKAAYTGAETLAGLYKIDMLTNTVSNQLDFQSEAHPNYLELNNNTLYYALNSSIYQVDTANFTLPTAALFSTNGQNLQALYGMSIINDTFYLADAKDYVSNGTVFKYALNGTYIESYPTKIIPNGFYNNN